VTLLLTRGSLKEEGNYHVDGGTFRELLRYYVDNDITDTDDTHFRWHGEEGTIVELLVNNADEVNGDSRDGTIYRVSLDEYDHELDLIGGFPPFD
jgi:hypothetical protein